MLLTREQLRVISDIVGQSQARGILLTATPDATGPGSVVCSLLDVEMKALSTAIVHPDGTTT